MGSVKAWLWKWAYRIAQARWGRRLLAIGVQYSDDTDAMLSPSYDRSLNRSMISEFYDRHGEPAQHELPDRDWVMGSPCVPSPMNLVKPVDRLMWDTDERLWKKGRDLMQRVNADPRVQERKRA